MIIILKPSKIKMMYQLKNNVSTFISILFLVFIAGVGSSFSQETVTSYLKKARELYEIHDFEGAITHNLSALKIAKENKDEFSELVAHHQVALIKSRTNDIEGALKIHLQKLKIFEKRKLKNLNEKEQQFYIDILVSTVNEYVDLKNYHEAEKYVNKAIELSKQFNYEKGELFSLISLANVYSLTERYPDALFYLEKASQLEEYKNREQASAFLILYKARVFYNQQKYQQSIFELEKIEMPISRKMYSSLNRQEINNLFAGSYQGLGNQEKATFYFEEELKVFDENDQLRMKLDPKIMKAYDTLLLQEDIDKLTNVSKKQQSKLYLVMICLGVLLISFFIFYKVSQNKNKKKFKALMEQLNEKKENKKPIAPESSKKKRETKIEDDKVRELLFKLEIFEKGEKYLDRNSTLAEVAKKLNTNTSYLSKIVNHHKGLTFTKYLTELRINYALNRLKNDPKFRSYTIKSIAQEVGFNSGEPFAKAFKAKTGIYPSYFIKELEKELV
ncbi:helix-turn-helix domain-containing protein [Flavobacteriaceae bacterium R38]|nr:helix-turn-helix domain-containing protein [Flavobacteriaceae bacterium R38]